MQHAYSVLSNPKLRSIYDSYGEQGLRMYESYTSFAEGSSDDGGGPTMVPLSPGQLASIVCGAIGLLVCLFTALCVDVLLKLNGSTDASLSLLLIPLWILDSFALLALYIFLTSTARKGQPSHSAVFSLIMLLLFVAFQVLVCVRVDGTHLPFWAVFLPLYVTEAIELVRACARVRPSAHDAERAAGKAHPTYAWHVLLTLGWPSARVYTLVLLVLRLDGLLALDWWLVFTPLYAYVLFYLCFGCQQLSTPVHSEREQMLQMGHRLCMLFTSVLALLLVLATLTLNGDLHSWLPFFMLPFIFSGCFCFCCCCVVCCVRMMPTSGPVEVPPGDGFDGATESGASTPRSEIGQPTEDAPLLPGAGAKGVYGGKRAADIV